MRNGFSLARKVQNITKVGKEIDAHAGVRRYVPDWILQHGAQVDQVDITVQVLAHRAVAGPGEKEVAVSRDTRSITPPHFSNQSITPYALAIYQTHLTPLLCQSMINQSLKEEPEPVSSKLIEKPRAPLFY